MLMDSGEYKVSECSPTAHWHHEAISCFWPNEASASLSVGFCGGGRGVGIVGGTYCQGTDAWTLQGSALWAPGPVLPGVTMGFHGSGTWTWTFGSAPAGLENEADTLRAEAEQ